VKSGGKTAAFHSLAHYKYWSFRPKRSGGRNLVYPKLRLLCVEKKQFTSDNHNLSSG